MEQKIPSGGAARVTSVTLVAGAVVLPAPRRGSSWCRVNGTGSPSDQHLELQEGRIAYYGLKKEARLEIPRQKSTCFGWRSGLLIFRPWELTTWTSTQET